MSRSSARSPAPLRTESVWSFPAPVLPTEHIPLMVASSDDRTAG